MGQLKELFHDEVLIPVWVLGSALGVIVALGGVLAWVATL